MTPIMQEITRRATIAHQAIILADILAHGTTCIDDDIINDVFLDDF